MKYILSAFLITLSTAAIPISALAAKPELVSGDWNVYKNADSCYISSLPIKQDGNYSKRETAYVIISRKKGRSDEINISSGYGYKKDSEVEVNVKGEKFKLFTQGEDAWAKNAQEDKKIIAAMKTGEDMVVKGVSHKETYSVDKYSLKGISKAYKKMGELCNK